MTTFSAPASTDRGPQPPLRFWAAEVLSGLGLALIAWGIVALVFAF